MASFDVGSLIVQGHGNRMAEGCSVAQPNVDASGARQIGEQDMNDAFDFSSYYDNDQMEGMTGYTPHEPHAAHQEVGTTQRDENIDIDSPEDTDDEDGWQDLVDSARSDYYSSNPLESSLIPPCSPSLEKDLVDPPYSLEVAKLATAISVEKWDVERASLDFLASVMALSASGDTVFTRYAMRPQFRDIKLEEPVLSTDAAMDMLRLRNRNIVRLTTTGIEQIASDRRHDQALQWSANSLKLPSEMDKVIAAEKMTVNGETSDFLRDILEDNKDDHTGWVSQARQKRSLYCPITPPLLPLSPSYSPGSIPSAAARLPFTSTPEDPLDREGRELEDQMMAMEEIQEESVDGSNISAPSKTVTRSSSSPLRRKFDKISDIKLSSPLLPYDYGPATKKTKTVSFAEELQISITDPSSDNVSTDPFVAAEQALAAVSAMVEPMLHSAMKQFSKEQLIEIDTTARVDVPHIGDIAPEPPWRIYSGRHRVLLGDSAATIAKAEKRWSGASSLERLLPWSPFPAHLGKPKAEGDFDDGSLARYLADLDIQGHVDLRRMMWKPEGLRILDFEDEEELDVYDYEHQDLEPDRGHLHYGAQVANMMPRDLNKSFHLPPSQLTQSASHDMTIPKVVVPPLYRFRPHIQNPVGEAHQTAAPQVNSMQALLEKRRVQLEVEKAALNAGFLSTSRSSTLSEKEASANHGRLSTFLAVQGVRGVHRVKEVSKVRRVEEEVQTRRPEPLPQPAKSVLEIPAPQMTTVKSTLPIVVSSKAMANRQVLRALQQHLPTLEIIERESTASMTNSSKQNEGSSPAQEADFTLSPSTGLMFTTLQKLKQKPLPGQEASFIGIREQFARVAPRYERLIILLSEGSHSVGEAQTHIRTLDERDATAIADLIGFFSRLDTEVQVSYVPGGEAELVKWIAAAVARWSPCIQEFNLLEEETVWERFLRKAGLNVFAAQVVLDQLKPPSDQLESDDSITLCVSGHERYGLAAFVGMDVEERCQRFGPLMGGEKMLRRASKAIDGSWNVGSRGR